MTYQLIDSGNEKKLEQFGDHLLIRPCAQALWKPSQPEKWKNAESTFEREKGWSRSLPPSWTLPFHGLTLKIVPTDFGHLGLFPEHALHFDPMKAALKNPSSVLNLFAYSGAATLALAQAGHTVCHVDAAKGIVEWARENAALSHLEKAPIRWIVDDALKFLKREIKRGRTYDALLLDPPTFGRGAQGQVFKIERDLIPLLQACKEVLTSKPAFVLLTCHTPGLTPTILSHLLTQTFPTLTPTSGEMLLPSESLSLPSGNFSFVQAIS
ncbi:MAG: class I SAM-dependent methyltransferase [Chlamydiia bacterium]|nr:class I SAM-dependent methyltransferase [Chlamydiia bacterium]